MGGYDGSININTKIDSSGFNKGIKGINKGLDGITSSLKGLAAAAGIAFGVAAVVNFGKASVSAATELSNAMLGLQGIMEGQGRSFKQAQDFIQQYTADGLIPATNAITAYKNLASRGYTDTQIQTVLQALKDSAAFGRQASYTLGEAVQTATEGLKNENSILVDNAGVTKNVAQMWKDYAASIGTTSDKLTKQQKIQAEVAGIMEETRFQAGDAAKLTGTYSGQIQQLGYNFNNLKIAVGNALIPIAQAVLPGLNAIITALTRVANLFAQVTTALFGRQATQQQAVANTANNIASNSSAAAKAQNKLADATKKAAKAADNSVASFDELNVLQQDVANNSATDSSPDVASDVGSGIITEQEIGSGVTVSPDVQKAVDKILFTFQSIKDSLIDIGQFIYDAFSGPISEVSELIRPQIDNFKTILSDMWSDIGTLGEPLKDWFMNDYIPYLQTVILTAGKIIAGLFDTFNMVFSDIWNIVVFPMLQKFVTVGLPLWTQFLTEAVKTLGILFDEVKSIFDKIWREGVAPALTEIMKIWSDCWDSLKTFWDTWGVPIFNGINEAIRNTSAFLRQVWDTIIKPVWDNFMQTVDDLWTNHLKPLLDKFLDFVGELAADALAIYNQFILPIVTWIVEKFGPPIAETINKIVSTVGWAIGIISDVVGGLITVLKGIIEFITGVFTGDWTKAWEGIRTVFKGIIETLEAIFRTPINAIIDMLNGLINGINQVISGLNRLSFSFPDDFPIKQWAGQSFGINIPKISTIPHLATGAVIPPRAEFAAILGDQRNGRNIEAPEGLIRSIVADEIAKIDIHPQVNVIASSDDAGFIRYVNFRIEQEKHRVGPAFATTGGGR